ncbi:MAG: cobalamin biosynthesis protein CobD [Bacteroidales bacterium]|nr:cobalamin biosynthesis protein CobD [Bacteroidales bacterium]
MNDILIHYLLPLLLAWGLDCLLGDPAGWPHPVVYFGKLIAWGERHLNHGSHRVLKGALLAMVLVLSVFGLAWGLLWGADRLHWSVGLGLRTLLIFFCLAGTTLRREVAGVFEAVESSLEAGRRQVARIVGRDTSALSAQEIRTAALETLAENQSDGVVAPLFWLALGGVPAMLAYKMVNTLDSMIGYRTERYRDFGRVAARTDDVANFLPARLTACLMVLASGRLSLFRFVRKYGPCHASPNSGWPEAALAGILDCRFGGPHYYFGELFDKPYIGTHDRPLSPDDLHRSLRISWLTDVLAILILVLVYCLFIML